MQNDLLKDRSIFEQLCKEYLNLKTLASGCCVDTNRVKECVNLLTYEINSIRKMSKISAIDALWTLLEHRNIMSMVKVEPLVKIESVVDDVEFTKRLQKYRLLVDQYQASVKRFYFEDLRHRDRRTLLEKEIELVKLGDHEPNANPNECIETNLPHRVQSTEKYSIHRKDIFDLLVKEIGRDWASFGRNLQLSSAGLFVIEERHSKDVKARINDILEEAEKGYSNGQDFMCLLGEALINIRRKDLKRRIDRLLS
ncbi:uncharacterized protein LOC129764967 [Toxorhynchites rutilus septentrionalis]|uniref:uncharacterized protein LOC129764967 n=1 Tax=Toxorhynchites rutilus septentrionalis TaxID=329112 RepID=UPI00247B198E|nr:uncharacterized protein LOC129764967 [Toxorhynchites rutilus septentrionalis]